MLDLKLAKIVVESSGLEKQSSRPLLMVNLQMKHDLDHPQVGPAIITKTK
jgi:hypothetical protein